jgi:hypothetical protein
MRAGARARELACVACVRVSAFVRARARVCARARATRTLTHAHTQRGHPGESLNGKSTRAEGAYGTDGSLGLISAGPGPYRSGDVRFQKLLVLFDAPFPRVTRILHDVVEIFDDRGDALAKLRRAICGTALRCLTETEGTGCAPSLPSKRRHAVSTRTAPTCVSSTR